MSANEQQDNGSSNSSGANNRTTAPTRAVIVTISQFRKMMAFLQKERRRVRREISRTSMRRMPRSIRRRLVHKRLHGLLGRPRPRKTDDFVRRKRKRE